ncbi:hypothetical protein [Cellulophaga sp. Hel_I_12]|uniref:hypothetical protein n=1 Tax=Cellulophaga sp. Hel_I_12 TaxID=1249972 RepID=UPI0006474F83|nr:hypothetical protein [Cellulophaga sp. Hel_I_12]
MKETLELRINYDFANLLFKDKEGKNLGTSVKIIDLSKDDPRYIQIPIIESHVKKKYDRSFFFGWEVKRKYSKKELNSAELFHIKIKTTFEPTGEECGTIFDETSVCEICGANRKQVGPLTLMRGTIPKKDIARTIAGEIVVSDKFVTAYKKRGLNGIKFEAVIFTKGNSDYYQLIAEKKLELSQNTIVGINPFDFSTSNAGELYNCPKGHTIGLNLISEPHVLRLSEINKTDFYASRQMIGVNRGLLKPESIYFCSQDFKKMVDEEKLKGFEFELTHIE